MHDPHASGDLIDRYKLLERIGSGRFGTVWMADQREPVRRRVAIKIITIAAERAAARVESSAAALATLDHPNVAAVFGAGRTPTDLPYLAIEYVRGVPVLAYCDRHELDTRARLDILVQVCHAVQHAHQKGIVHGDIKPSNVLITLHDGTPVAKVIDFGLARALSAGERPTASWTASSGTARPATPPNDAVDTRSDVYALGALLSDIVDQTPGDELGWIVTRCLERHRTSRYPTALALADDIERLSSGEPIDAAPQTAGYRVRKFASRNRGAVVAACALVGVLILTVVAANLGLLWTLQDRAAALAHADDTVTQARDAYEAERAARHDAETRAAIADETLRALLDTLGGRGDVDLAIVAATDAASRTREALGAEHVETIRRDLFVGMLLSNARRNTDAVDRLEDAHARARRVAGDDAEPTWTAALALAKALSLANRHDESVRLTESVAASRRAHLDPADPLIGDASFAHATSLAAHGAFVDAARVHAETLAFREHALRTDDVRTLASRTALAKTYGQLGRYDEAIALVEHVLESTRLRVGSDDPATMAATNDLAFMHGEAGQFTLSESLYRTTLGRARSVLGPDDAFVAETLAGLAKVLVFQRRSDDAVAVADEALTIAIRVHGADDHPEVLPYRARLAGAVGIGRNTDRAFELTAPLLEDQRRVLGPRDLATLDTMTRLAVIAITQRRIDDARTLLLDATTRYDAIAPRHPSALAARGHLGTVHGMSGRHEDALHVLQRVYDDRVALVGPDHVSAIADATDLARAMMAAGRGDDAIAVAAETIARSTRLRGADHPQTLALRINHGLMHHDLQRDAEAAELLDDAFEDAWSVHGLDHRHTRNALNGLTAALHALDRRDDALAVHRRILEDVVKKGETADASFERVKSAALALVRSPYPELRDAERAVVLATTGVERGESMSDAALSAALDTLARAQYAAGNAAAALHAQTRAIALSPEDADPQMTRRLKEYERAMREEP